MQHRCYPEFSLCTSAHIALINLYYLFNWVNPRLCRGTQKGLTFAAVVFQVIAMIAALLFPTLPRRGSRTLWVQKGGEGGFADGDVQTHRFKIPLIPPLLKWEAKSAAALGGSWF